MTLISVPLIKLLYQNHQILATSGDGHTILATAVRFLGQLIGDWWNCIPGYRWATHQVRSQGPKVFLSQACQGMLCCGLASPQHSGGDPAEGLSSLALEASDVAGQEQKPNSLQGREAQSSWSKAVESSTRNALVQPTLVILIEPDILWRTYGFS